jgi:hypothetical protein
MTTVGGWPLAVDSVKEPRAAQAKIPAALRAGIPDSF